MKENNNTSMTHAGIKWRHLHRHTADASSIDKTLMLGWRRLDDGDGACLRFRRIIINSRQHGAPDADW